MKLCGKAQNFIDICKVIPVKHKIPCDFKERGKAFEDNLISELTLWIQGLYLRARIYLTCVNAEILYKC